MNTSTENLNNLITNQKNDLTTDISNVSSKTPTKYHNKPIQKKKIKSIFDSTSSSEEDLNKYNKNLTQKLINNNAKKPQNEKINLTSSTIKGKFNIKNIFFCKN